MGSVFTYIRTKIYAYRDFNKLLQEPLGDDPTEARELQLKQEAECNAFHLGLKNKEDNERRKLAIEAGVSKSLVNILQKRELFEITRPYSLAYFRITAPASDEVQIMLFEERPYPGLVHCLSHSDIEVIDDAIGAIFNILSGGANTAPLKVRHPHYSAMQSCGGITALYDLFRRDLNKFTKDLSAVCLGELFQ